MRCRLPRHDASILPSRKLRSAMPLRRSSLYTHQQARALQCLCSTSITLTTRHIEEIALIPNGIFAPSLSLLDPSSILHRLKIFYETRSHLATARPAPATSQPWYQSPARRRLLVDSAFRRIQVYAKVVAGFVRYEWDPRDMSTPS
ncbi:hypothetical protein A0H81_10826 [Grifola frondosa]|uniref:Uncharacterized protein n=1 Tax=Grifola frondosa TaxID=5627 RepID=A0A1C7LX59_GRIFR|nr:hypothetical protein A0H81_10826 [Grifola frondosa]